MGYALETELTKARQRSAEPQGARKALSDYGEALVRAVRSSIVTIRNLLISQEEQSLLPRNQHDMETKSEARIALLWVYILWQRYQQSLLIIWY